MDRTLTIALGDSGSISLIPGGFSFTDAGDVGTMLDITRQAENALIRQMIELRAAEATKEAENNTAPEHS